MTIRTPLSLQDTTAYVHSEHYRFLRQQVFSCKSSTINTNGHLRNKSGKDAAPGNEVSNRKAVIITINYICNLHRPPYFLNKSSLEILKTSSWKNKWLKFAV